MCAIGLSFFGMSNSLWPLSTNCPMFDFTAMPTSQPTGKPSMQPTKPSPRPSMQPSSQPTSLPSHPSQSPSQIPSQSPSQAPSQSPSQEPSQSPSYEPSSQSPLQPTSIPTPIASQIPSQSPTYEPTSEAPLQSSQAPFMLPLQPTNVPTLIASQPSKLPPPTSRRLSSSDTPVWCTWSFITCDPRTHAVVAFDAGSSDNNHDRTMIRSSTLPTAFGSLTNLQRLSLHGVGLVGTIPSSIFSSLNQLTFLDMGNNELVGTLPSSLNVAFVPLQGAKQLDLSSNYLTGTVPSSLTNLQYTYLGNNEVQWTAENNCWLVGGGYGHCPPPTPGSNQSTTSIILFS